MIDTTESLFGFYRSKVVYNKDPKKMGRVLLWIPDIMPLISDDKGLWASPANNPVGGRNLEEGDKDKAQYYQGSSYIPQKGSWTFCFFEAGDINRPYYFGALDIENTKVLPENQTGANYQDKWTIFKSHNGRCIIVSDDPYDERIEITGKKRKLTNPPTGDLESIYEIDDNQTTILFDERQDVEKILIRTHKGDFFHIDINEQKLQTYFKNDIIIRTDKSLFLTVKEDIHLKALKGDINIQSDSSNIHTKAALNTNNESGGESNIKSSNGVNIEATSDINLKAAGDFNVDGSDAHIQNGNAGGAGNAEDASLAEPIGKRNT